MMKFSNDPRGKFHCELTIGGELKFSAVTQNYSQFDPLSGKVRGKTLEITERVSKLLGPSRRFLVLPIFLVV